MKESFCVVLDIDDTLYLERDYVRSGFKAVSTVLAERMGAAGFFEVAWGLFLEGRRGRIFDEGIEAMGIPPDPRLVSELVTVYRTHSPEITLLPDSQSFLEWVRKRARMAAITDGPLESQQAKARALGLSSVASPIIYTALYGDGYSKPHPRAFLEVEAATGCSGGKCVYIADNPQKDFDSPLSLGWKSIRIRRPLSLHVGVNSPGRIHAECESLDFAKEFLEDWLSG